MCSRLVIHLYTMVCSKLCSERSCHSYLQCCSPFRGAAWFPKWHWVAYCIFNCCSMSLTLLLEFFSTQCIGTSWNNVCTYHCRLCAANEYLNKYIVIIISPSSRVMCGKSAGIFVNYSHIHTKPDLALLYFIYNLF